MGAPNEMFEEIIKRKRHEDKTNEQTFRSRSSSFFGS